METERTCKRMFYSLNLMFCDVRIFVVVMIIRQSLLRKQHKNVIKMLASGNHILRFIVACFWGAPRKDSPRGSLPAARTPATSFF